MRYLPIVCYFALSLVICGGLHAQEAASTLPAELGWVKFRIAAGRLQVASGQYRESRDFSSGNPLTGTSETLRLNFSAQSATVHYEQKTPQRNVTVDFESPQAVNIEVTPGEADAPGEVAMKYSQQRDGPVLLLVDDGDATGEHKAASFWHLMLLAPDDCRKHLLPVLSTLRPGWQIAENADGIEDALVKLADSPIRPDRTRWAKLVEQLGSPSFRQRRSAERQLRQAGPAVFAYLSSLSPESLDAEREARINRLLEALSSSTDDTPDRVAMWLIDDPLVWTTVLQSENEAHRAAAKTELEHLLGREIEFDPKADEVQRAAWVRAIRLQLKDR